LTSVPDVRRSSLVLGGDARSDRTSVLDDPDETSCCLPRSENQLRENSARGLGAAVRGRPDLLLDQSLNRTNRPAPLIDHMDRPANPFEPSRELLRMS
jgi:hypothetical protein